MASSSPRWLRERAELSRAMREAPSALPKNACDMVPPMELVGVYICMATVAEMCHNDELDLAAGAFLNAIFGCEAFAILHHCTHESISQGNDEFKTFENAVFRLGCAIIFFDDGYREAHRKHHQSTNEPDDPDRIMSHTSLPALGSMIFEMGSKRTYVGLGVPIEDWMVTWAHRLGLTEQLMRSSLTKRKLIRWDHVTLKMLTYEILEALEKTPAYESILRTTQATWRSASQLSLMLLALFFARYPHRNGVELKDETDSFYDATYRGQGQVDLFMLGEGPHHMHHAKSDVSYARLPRIAREVEQSTDFKVKSRSNGDIAALEYTHNIAPKTAATAEGPGQFAYERTRCVERGIELWASANARNATVEIVRGILHGALHIVKRADRKFLRKVFRDMKLDRSREVDPMHPLPTAQWTETVLSDETARRILDAADALESRTRLVCDRLATRLDAAGLSRASALDLRKKYVDIFVAIADTFVSKTEQTSFASKLAARFSTTLDGKRRADFLRRLKIHLHSPIPSNFFRLRKLFSRGILRNLFYGAGKDSESIARARLRVLLFGSDIRRPPKSRL